MIKINYTKALALFSISPNDLKINYPNLTELSSILNRECTFHISYKIPDSFNIKINLSSFLENLPSFGNGKISSKIHLLSEGVDRLDWYNNLLASSNRVASSPKAVSSVLEMSGISNNYHINHSALESSIQFLTTHPYVIICFFPVIYPIISSNIIRFANIGLEVWKMLSNFFTNYPRFLTLPILPSGLPIVFRYHNLEMWWYTIAKLLGLFDIYKSLLIKYLNGLAANLQAKLYLAHYNRIMDSSLYNEKIKISLNLVKKSIHNTNRGIESLAGYISKAGRNLIDLCSISLVTDTRRNPLFLPNEIRKMIQEYILISAYRYWISEYILMHHTYVRDGDLLNAEWHDWINCYILEQSSIHSNLNRADLNLSRIEALGGLSNNRDEGWYLYESDMSHLIDIAESLSDIWERLEHLREKAILWGYPLLEVEFQEHFYLRIQLPFCFADVDTFFIDWILNGYNF